MLKPDRPPLWQMMEAAYHKRRGPGLSERHDYAAEIRAVRDWLVPENWVRPDDPADRVRWRRDMQLRALLTAEANRAERGDG